MQSSIFRYKKSTINLKEEQKLFQTIHKLLSEQKLGGLATHGQGEPWANLSPLQPRIPLIQFILTPLKQPVNTVIVIIQTPLIYGSLGTENPARL